MTKTISLEQVENIAFAALCNSGASAEQSAPVAWSIRAAEAEGTRGIGLGFLPYYCNHLRVGKIRGEAVPVVTQLLPGTVAVDAADGFAHPAFEAAENLLVETTQTQGIAVLGISNAYACGVLGYFTDRLARRGLISLMAANASSTMAPWGGKTPFFGTNPWAFGAPREGDPLVIDSSSSATAFVNLANAAATGEPIPAHWALDTEGQPTTDPTAAMAGSIAPAGGHKGGALALMVEVLSAGLSGAHWSFEASSLGDDIGGPPRLGQTIIAIRPDGLGAVGFTRSLEGMLAAMVQDEGVRIPGDRRHKNRQHAVTEGVKLSETEVTALMELSKLEL
ncbi:MULTISPECIES: Ldh family oxidoreductase [unclassified Ruegeria]|uniref:Ldh family oxidoreductase n=1 Tax=unclassified Ruegeria TaxID=2625375 RepID=UPI001489A09F|nr:MULTISPECIES: Ldh family oxidoreductase [unclassified Ruegeria]NOD64687.1 Ldh family oxidoreductase [Ruegeria sp. HKCCD6109]